MLEQAELVLTPSSKIQFTAQLEVVQWEQSHFAFLCISHTKQESYFNMKMDFVKQRRVELFPLSCFTSCFRCFSNSSVAPALSLCMNGTYCTNLVVSLTSRLAPNFCPRVRKPSLPNQCSTRLSPPWPFEVWVFFFFKGLHSSAHLSIITEYSKFLAIDWYDCSM